MEDSDYRDLIERAHRLQKLSETPDWDLLSDYVKAMIYAKNRALLNGNAKTLEEYRAMAGWIQGAEAVMGAALTLEKQLEIERARREREAD